MEENKMMEKRLEQLEERVRLLEEGLQLSSSIVYPDKQKQQYVTQEEKKPVEWDILIFQKILPPLFIVVFIIGVLWGFKAVSDYGILTAPVKVMLGYVVGFVLIGLGVWQIKQSRKSLGQMLLGGAIPVLMLTTFAMHQLYAMTGPTTSFLLNILWIMLGLFFTYRYKSQGIGIVSTVGGVFVPFLIKSTSPNIAVFSFYEAILFTLFLWIALRLGYKLLFYVSVVFLQIALITFTLFTGNLEEHKLLYILPVFVQQGALLIGILLSKQMLRDLAYTLFSVMLVSLIWIELIFTTNEASIIIVIIGLIYGACLYKYQKDVIRTPIFIANASLALLYLVQLQLEDLFFEGLIGLSLVYLYVYKKFNNTLHIILAAIAYFFALMYISNYSIDDWLSWGMLHWIVFLVGTSLLVYYSSLNNKQSVVVRNIGVPYFAALFLYFLYMIGSLVAGDVGSNLERVFTSALWIITAVLFMLLSGRLSLQQGKYVGVGILFFTLAKIILFDISFVTVPIKALLFIVLGIVGLLVSRVYYKK